MNALTKKINEMVDLQRNFIRNLRKRLEERQMSQAELARRMHVNPTHISQLFSGNRNAGLQTIESAAKALRIHPLELLVDDFDSK